MRLRRFWVIAVTVILVLSACTQNKESGSLDVALFSNGDLDQAESAFVKGEVELESIDLNVSELTKEVGLSEQEVLDEESDLVSQAVLSRVNGYLAYYRENGREWQLWISDQSDDSKTLVYSSSYEVQSVAVSGDGNWVTASIKGASAKYDIYLFDLVNARMFNLTNSTNKDEFDVSITALGDKIVYSKPTNTGLWKINVCDYDSVANSCSLSVLGAQEDQVQGSISSNGSYIALIRKLANGRDRVFVYDLNANTHIPVISRLEALSHPSVSNDGMKVMYLRDRTEMIGRHVVRVADLLNQTLENELSSTGLDHPNLTSDGNYFTYKGVANSRARVFTREINSNQRASAAGGPWDYGGAYWQRNDLDVCIGSPFIPDINLETIIRENLNVTEISCEDMLSLTSLYGSNDGISDLTGLQHATNLQLLDLGRNPIDDLSILATLTNLEELFLGNNNIENIDFLGGLVNLKRLALVNNEIRDITALAGLSNLQSLFISGNRIANIDALASLDNLEVLYSEGNTITDLSPLANLVNLRNIWISSNRIRDIGSLESTDLSNLNEFRLGNNFIDDLSPLVNNEMLSAGVWLIISNNCLDLSSPPDSTHISVLEDRVRRLTYEPQRVEGCS